MLFERVHAFKHEPHTPEEKRLLAAGFNILAPKGAFVEGSNWLPIHPWDFVVGLEHHLLARFDTQLIGAVRNKLHGADVSRDASEILQAIDALSEQIQRGAPTPTIAVLAGDLGMRVHVDLRTRLMRDWTK